VEPVIGSIFVTLALERGHEVTMLANNPDKVTVKNDKLTVVKGDTSLADDVQKIVKADTDILVSCLGNTGGRTIMETVAGHILAAKPKRALVISSLGMGGSSPVVRFVLSMINFFIRQNNVPDYDAANGLLTGKPGVVVIRPDGLADGEGKGKYNATEKTGMGPGGLPKADVALFLADLIEDIKWDGGAVQLYTAKKIS
jgi:hypothetical protein